MGRTSSKLSKAHIWSKHLKAKFETLSCTLCNNKIGSNLEGEEKKRLVSNNGELISEAKLALPNAKESVLTSIYVDKSPDKHDLILELLENHSNPKAYKDALAVFDKAEKTGIYPSFSIEFNEPFDRKKAYASYLHSEYLFLFHNFGYEFWNLRVAERMRSQIWSPHESHYPLITDSDHDKNLQVFDQKNEPEEPILCVITEPEILTGFFVGTPQLRPYGSRRVFMLLPIVEPFFENFKIEDIAKFQVKVSHPFKTSPDNLVTERAKTFTKDFINMVLNYSGVKRFVHTNENLPSPLSKIS